TAIFSVVHTVLMTPLEYPESDRLVQVGHAALDGSFGITAHTSSNYVVWKEAITSFESMAAWGFESRSLTGHGGDAELLRGVSSIGSIFDVLGVSALRGRTFSEAEDRPGPESFVVVSHALWQSVFGGQEALGSTLVLGGRPYQVIGVMPPDFSYPTPGIHFWITSEMESEELATSLDWSYRTVARLATGRTVEQAGREIEAIAARLREERPEANRNVTAQVVAIQDLMVRNVRALLLVLSGTVAIVLVIACLNLASLLLSRGAARAQELALRRAIGASPGRLLRQLLSESLVLALLAGAVGLAVASGCIYGISRWVPWGLPRTDELGVDPLVMGIAFLLAGGSALLFGGIPAMRFTKSSIGHRLRDHGRGATRRGLSGKLVTVEVALSVVLLVGAGLLTRSFAALAGVDPGFESEGRIMFGLSLADDSPVGGRVAFFRELEQGLAALPGVRSVGITTAVPVSNWGSSTRVDAMDSQVAEDDWPDAVAYRVISPDYFRAIGIELKRGRPFSRDDGQEGTPSVVVNEAMADAFWPGEEVLGKRLRAGLWPSPGGSGRGWLPPTTVVGVVENVLLYTLAREAPPTIYLVHEMLPYRGRFQVVIHADGELEALVGSVRGVVSDLDSNLPVFGVNTLDDVVSSSVASQRNSMTLLGILGGVGLLMAMIGVYGVLSFLVSRQGREIGIRMVLGAEAVDVRRRVVLVGMREVAWGLALGIGGALCLTRFMESLLFRVSPTDPATLLGISFLLAIAAALAAYLPARRATLVDPVAVLEAE
ncbi:ABC transporter permease, partial [Gemmatimonadota bacterium]